MPSPFSIDLKQFKLPKYPPINKVSSAYPKIFNRAKLLLFFKTVKNIFFSYMRWERVLLQKINSYLNSNVDKNKVFCQGDSILPYQHSHYDVDFILDSLG
jgi:hypothetical protein